MTTDLDDYQAAYERVERQLELQRDWGFTEARIRRRLHRPTWRLVRTLLVILICIAAGSSGASSAWGLAIGLCLAVLPGRIASVKARRIALAGIESADDVRALCAKESRLEVAGVFIRSLTLGALSVVFLLTAFIAWQLDKSSRTGIIAALLCIAWSAVNFFVLLPRASRAAELFERAAADGVGDDRDG